MNPCGVQFARPIRPPGLQHTQHLARRALVIRREHHAEGGQHDVEAAVVERQCLGIGHLKLHGQIFRTRALAPFVQQRRHIVGRGHVGEATCRRKRRVAVAGGDIEHTLAGAHIGGFGERFADDLQRGTDDGEVAAGPGGLLALLDRGEIRHGEIGAAARLSSARVMELSLLNG